MVATVVRPAVSVVCLAAVSLLAGPVRPAAANELSREEVLQAIERGKRFLIGQQNADGSWSGGRDRFKDGVSALALLSLVNCGMTPQDEAVRKGLGYLRSLRDPEPSTTYEVSLVIMALAAAKDGDRDKHRILTLAQRLEDWQIKNGENEGSWTYGPPGQGFIDLGGDRSNAQFAVLGLHEAAEAGIPIDRVTWERARRHWITSQSPDGGWGYAGRLNPASSGSMTAAGIATLAITQSMLREDGELSPDGKPVCCPEGDDEDDEAMSRAVAWMEKNFAVGHNPRMRHWHLYYLYGLERAGRLSGRRFFGDHDWYREGARLLARTQSARGFWRGEGHMENDPVIATSLSLLFLSKGLAPVLINKIKHGPADPDHRFDAPGENWNKHRDDVRNLTQHISGLPRWPKLVTWQTLDINRVAEYGSVDDLRQAPVVYLSGEDAPELTDDHVELLVEYVNQGGFIFAVANCNGAGFDDGFRELIRRMYPQGEAELKRLEPDHPVYRSEHPLDAASVELWGVDFGCRTAIIYSPDDLSCLWNYWARQEPPNRAPELSAMVHRKVQVGVNVIAYATGREPPDAISAREQLSQEGQQDRIERGFLQVAKIRHSGTWDAAPQALRSLLAALNRTVGLSASTQQRALAASDPNIFKYPVVYMHGRNRFQLGEQERSRLREYLLRGGVLFADACCGDRQFDHSFRELVRQLFPDRAFERIPPDHEMFTSRMAFDVRRVQRRAPEADQPDVALNPMVTEGEPFLEGIEIDGRYAVIYSKYDISCALERQASVACAGYLHDDALRLAVNVVVYAMLQDASYSDPAE